MNQLFDALRERHPGYDVVDVRFLVQQGDGRHGNDLDASVAQAIRNAKRVDMADATK